MADVLRSWIAQNWNAKTATIAAVATATGIAVVYLWKSDKKAQFIAKVLTDAGNEYDRLMRDRKRQLFADLESLKDVRGDGRLVLLEIGCGGGNNFKYYPAGSEVICVEPNRHYEAEVHESVRQHPEVRNIGVSRRDGREYARSAVGISRCRSLKHCSLLRHRP